MSELNASGGHQLFLQVAEPPEPRSVAARLDCQGCPVASGEVPDISCAECVVSVFLGAEPWPDQT